MFCCKLLYVNSSISIIMMGKRELVALLNLFSWCLVMVKWLFLAVLWGCLRFTIVVFLIILSSIFGKPRVSISVLKTLPGTLDIKHHSPVVFSSNAHFVVKKPNHDSIP